MAKVKKFGTFSGVFTPSILTILGVIMYLRFPTIIGQAGLINTIGIIAIAHIISITTSLSVASLSTDKPVQTGGTYFMISRSLGLPIGGTLGLALFVGLSFSVSLYLIGFAESFLQYWGMEVSINTIRITGTIVLLAVTTITFISTSLAIKSQYFIMAAILLSLISIFFGHHEFTPQSVHMKPLKDAAPFMLLFGIFFPAVTGFEAGVSMSGDLKNPRKSLPVGAMLAVIVGFIVYLGLALFYSYTVDANALVNDPQILFKISLVPALVIAGIWGATLSSALGSILGAPRILQAIAMDKIAPRFLAKGTGKTNEPRNALLIAFVIAEVGILIGELDVIARIVSMFFITTYAFLNLASAIESWSSSDFRPAFKIPRFVSILGALSAFIVMILLDFLALAGATIVLGLLYFYLQRKELILETGDAWSSFWTNLAKKALLKLSFTKENKRNWRPNIILFSGGEEARPHLVEMGLSLTGKLGALTDFNISIGDRKKTSNEKQTESRNKVKNRGYFWRHLNCNSLKDGIKTVTNIYGFSGFEPNTVLMGWSKSSQNTSFLCDILDDLKTKYLNAVFLAYDKIKGFGKKETIDIWWNAKGRHLSFSLDMLRFLLSDPSWHDARVRIKIINSDTSLNESIFLNTNAVLQNKRIRAEIKIISDDFGSRTLEEIIWSESADTDLVLLGLSGNIATYTQEYIEKINRLCELPVSVLLLSPSEEFEVINFVERLNPTSRPVLSSITKELDKLPEIEIKLVKNKIGKLDEDLIKIGEDFCERTIRHASNQMYAMISDLHEYSEHLYTTLKKDFTESGKHEYQKVIDRHHVAYLRNILKIINDNNRHIKEMEAAWQNGIPALLTNLRNYIYESTESISVPFHIPSKKKEKMYDYPYRKVLSFYLEKNLITYLNTQLIRFEEESRKLFAELRKLIMEFSDKLEKLQIENKKEVENINNDFEIYFQHFNMIEKQSENITAGLTNSLMNTLRQISIQMANNLKTPEDLRSSRRIIKEKWPKNDEYLSLFAETWGTGMKLLNSVFYHDTMVLTKKIVFRNIIYKGIGRTYTIISDTLFSKQKKLIENLNATLKNIQTEIEPVLFPDNIDLKIYLNESYEKAINLIDDFPEELLLPEFIYKEGEFIPFSDYNKIEVNVHKSAYYYVDVLLYEPLYRDFQKLEVIVRKAIIESKEANSMLLFHQNNLQSDKADEADFEAGKALIKKLEKQVEEENVRVEKALVNINHSMENYISEAFSKLFYHSITEAGKTIQSGEREQKSRKLTLSLIGLSKKIKNKFNLTLIYILNSTSRGIILSKKYLQEKRGSRTQTKEILDLVDELLPDQKVYNAVPIFYRNLLSSSSKIIDEFWIPRKMEMEDIKEAYYRHRNGFGGSVILTGVHGAGKTTLTRFAVNHLFKPHNIVWINGPAEGSVNPDCFLNELKKSKSGFDNITGIFDSMPYESTIVINDLELWWERRSGGGDTIEYIINLIKQYSHKVFFLINCNIYAFNIIKQIYPIEEYSLATIPCGAFSAKELEQMILQRHKSSGINMLYKGKLEDSISQLSYSILFNKYFILSEGMPGVAINIWKANIQKYEADTISIKKPLKTDPGILYNLPTDWLVILSLFIQHKNLNADKLTRITGMSPDKSEGLLLSIKDSGLLVKKSGNVYTLGRNTEPLIVKVCEKKGLI